MTHAGDSDRHLSRATVIAAVIGAVGVIAAALIGHRTGQEQGSRKLDVMEKQLAESSAAIVELRTALNAEAQKVATLNEQIKQARGTTANPQVNIAAATDTPTMQTDREFRYQLKGCSVSASRVTCDLLVTNLGPERRLSIKRDVTRLLSDAGDEYVATRLKLGVDESGFTARATIPAGSSIGASLRFDSVRPNTTVFQSLRLGGETWGEGISNQRTAVTFPSVTAR